MIKKNDMVQVIAGKSRGKTKLQGKTGKVIAVFPEKGRAVVEKMNMVKRHSKPTQKMPQGGIIEKEASIHLSNLQLICPRCSGRTRISYTVLADLTKKRICKRCKEII